MNPWVTDVIVGGAGEEEIAMGIYCNGEGIVCR